MNFDFFKSKKIVVLALINISQSALVAKINLGRFPTSVQQKLQQVVDLTQQVKENKAKTSPQDTNKKDTTKDLSAVIKEAKCRKTLEEGLRKHGYDVIADAFKDVTTQMGALAAYLSMQEPYKSKLKAAFDNHQAHLASILGL